MRHITQGTTQGSNDGLCIRIHRPRDCSARGLARVSAAGAVKAVLGAMLCSRLSSTCAFNLSDCAGSTTPEEQGIRKPPAAYDKNFTWPKFTPITQITPLSSKDPASYGGDSRCLPPIEHTLEPTHTICDRSLQLSTAIRPKGGRIYRMRHGSREPDGDEVCNRAQRLGGLAH